jgi:hypothetical protein
MNKPCIIDRFKENIHKETAAIPEDMYLPIWSIKSSCAQMPAVTTISTLCDNEQFHKD